MNPIEIRVHGVGDHGPLSALGSVGLEPAAQTLKGIESYKKPKIPAHDLTLVNWSRTSRGVAGFLWYLAVPFTLLNVVGYMKPAGGRRAWYTSVTRVAGVLATVVLTAWLIVITETVLEYVPGLAGKALLAEALSAWLPAAAVAVAILCRTWLRPERRIPPVLACVHALFALLVATVVFVCKPARTERTGWPNNFGYGGDVPGAALGAGTDPRADAMMIFVLGSTLIAAALASALWNSAAAVVTMLVFLVLHATGAILRLGAGWLMAYMEYIAVADRTSGMAPSAHLLRAADPEGDRVLLLDLVPIVACAAIVGFAAAFAIAACTSKWKDTREQASLPAYRRRRFVHLVITALAQIIRRALIWAAAIYTALAIVIGAVALNTSWSGWPLTVALILTHTIVAVVLVFIAMRGKVSAAAKVLGTVADVAGFWPVRYHPLAGSSYRDEVVGGLRDALERHREDVVVLFAHSQGSVLGTWLLANEKVPETLQDDATPVAVEGPSLLPPKGHLYLLTCGSPLKSLYRGFFPSYFHDRFFLRASERTAGWFNAWRETDPIATAMPGVVSGHVHDEKIAEVDPGLLRVHSDYWIEEAPTIWIQEQLTPPGGTTP